MSTRNPTHGTKVQDPKATHIEEAGAVTNDSLAAESTRASGGFSENRHSEPLGVKGANSTFATTDTSAAETLEPAANSKARQAAKESSADSYPSASSGQSKSTAVTDTSGSVETGGAEAHVDLAPSYVNSQFKDVKGPKGRNLKEGGFDEDDSKNASFTSDIGDKNDPGRAAEEKFAKENVDRAAGVARREKGGRGVGNGVGIGDEGIYDQLDESTV